LTKKIAYISFNSVGILFATISVVSYIIIIIDTGLVYSLSFGAFNNFFKYFDFPIKFMVGAIASFTLGVTFLRAFQFDESLKILDQNNRFNNYFKFKEEFEKHFLKSRIVSILSPEYFKEPKQIVSYLFNYLYGTNIQEFNFRVLVNPYNELLDASEKAKKLYLDDNLPIIVLHATNGKRPEKLAGSKFVEREIRMQVSNRQKEIIEEKYSQGLIGVKYDSSIHLNCLNTFLQYLLLEELSYFDNQILKLNSNFVISISEAFEPYFRNVGLPDFKR